MTSASITPQRPINKGKGKSNSKTLNIPGPKTAQELLEAVATQKVSVTSPKDTASGAPSDSRSVGEVDFTKVQPLDCITTQAEEQAYRLKYLHSQSSAVTQSEVVAESSRNDTQDDTQNMFYGFVPSPEAIQVHHQQVSEQVVQATERPTEVVQMTEVAQSDEAVQPMLDSAAAGSVDSGIFADMDLDEILKDVLNPPPQVQDTTSFIRVEITHGDLTIAIAGPREKVQLEAMKHM